MNNNFGLFGWFLIHAQIIHIPEIALCRLSAIVGNRNEEGSELGRLLRDFNIYHEGVALIYTFEDKGFGLVEGEVDGLHVEDSAFLFAALGCDCDEDEQKGDEFKHDTKI